MSDLKKMIAILTITIGILASCCCAALSFYLVFNLDNTNDTTVYAIASIVSTVAAIAFTILAMYYMYSLGYGEGRADAEFEHSIDKLRASE